MTQSDQEFLKKLRAGFKVEAAEHLQAIASGLLELESVAEAAARHELIARIFREAHSLKGAARTVNASQIETICQKVEGVFAVWRRQGVTPEANLLDPLHLAINLIGTLLGTMDNGDGGVSDDTIGDLISRLSQLESNSPAPSPTPSDRSDEPGSGNSRATGPSFSPEAIRISGDTIRISAGKLDALVIQAEEMLAVKGSINDRAASLKSLGETLFDWNTRWTRYSTELRNNPDNGASNGSRTPDAIPMPAVLEFLEWGHAQILSLQQQVATLTGVADHDRRAIGNLVEELLVDSKKLLMFPFSTLFETFPKLVRDLSRDQGKEVDLVITGADVEIDKRILEELKDPLVHMLRNSIDHGIESPQNRVKLNKPPRGAITLAVSLVNGDKCELVVSDDGGGMNPALLRDAAVRQGVLPREEADQLSDQNLVELAFHPEVTTTPIITEISGRGLGLAIVKEKVQKLDGTVETKTVPGAGTTIRLRLPLTLATFRGLMVAAGGQRFVVPTAGILCVARVASNSVQTVENHETILLDGRPIPLVHLHRILELREAAAPEKPEYLSVFVLTSNGNRIGFAVSEILGEQEVLVKRLAKPLLRVRNVAGASILSSGKAIVVLNVADLIHSATRPSAGRPAPAQESESQTEKKSLLVVEDSITARMLLKNILESSGYAVKTAVDGLDAIAALRSEPFDLVVSDVEMPRMNGFELTAKIRSDKKLSETPVVLVTALATKEDRERGIDVGASAYIVKSSFDQSNLLAVIQRLM